MVSDWADESAHHQSEGVYTFLPIKGAVSWQLRKEDPVAMSTLEAEYIACSMFSDDAKRLPQLRRDILGKYTSSLPINCDNQGTLSHIATGIIKARTKHVDVCYQKR
jgi:hypothetical protein